MQIDTYLYVVWARRSAESIFGPASKPVMIDGGFLCYKTEHEARVESDRLKARTGGSCVRYNVRPIHVEIERPSAEAEGASAAPYRVTPPSMPASRAA
jgi:hypothetical protein